MYELKMVADNYPHIMPLKDGRVTSDMVHLEFTEFPYVYHAFDDQVENRTYDICELAVGTFFQALDFDKHIKLLPVVCLGSFHHGNIWYDPTYGEVTPKDLIGSRIAVRAYTQTTGLWCRGALEEHFGISPESVTWVTTEAPHVAGYICPPNVVRAPEGSSVVQLVTSGDCRAAIMLPRYTKGTGLKPVLPNAQELADDWYKKHKAIPINHMITVKEELAQNHPEVVQEVYNMIKRSYQLAADEEPLSPALRIGREEVKHTLDVCMEYCLSQKLISRRFSEEEIFAPGIY